MSTAAAANLIADESKHDRRRDLRVVARGVAGHLQTMDASMPGLAVENLSQGGMFVRCASALAVGTRVMVQLVRPGLKRAIPVEGCVVSAISPAEAQKKGAMAGMGIRLHPVELEAAQRLRDLVDDLACAAPARAPVAPVRPVLVAAVPPVRPVLVAPPPPAAVPAAPPAMVEAPAPAPVPAEDDEARSRLVRQLEDEVVALRRELLRRNRTIRDLATRLAVYEGGPKGRGLGQIREVVCHAGDPRAE